MATTMAATGRVVPTHTRRQVTQPSRRRRRAAAAAGTAMAAGGS
jgi:hypothetical protein